ncbi:MAG: GMP/IMP nucleotidase [Kangiellaceae bacterium]|nr:GMP/IMP nucleotidase [Kangiellaceae bacterium]MCW8999190.1 GMP/IMP nucleotidase [Kangiellaceae bacterium]
MNPVTDWDEIDTVLLDMDGTILDLAFDNYFWLEYMPQVFAEKNAISLDESRKFLSESYGELKGKLQWYCLDFWSEKLNLDIPALKKDLGHMVAFRPGAVEFLEFLSDKKKSVYLATNAHRKTLEIKMLNADFNQYFCELTSSHDFGHPKEEQEYWHLLREKFPFDPQRTLFIDDSVTVLESAKRFGIKHLYGILVPDSRKGPINSSPFESIASFEEWIANEK